MRFALATISRGDGPAPAIEVDGKWFWLDRAAPDLFRQRPGRGLMELFTDWETSERRLLDLAQGLSLSGHSTDSPRPTPEDFLTPLQYPAKLVLGGANYYEHMAKDAGKTDFRKEDGTPVFFLKPPTTCLVGPGKTVPYPQQTSKLDWEIELAVIVGQRLRHAGEVEALQGVAGYAVGIDLSARDWQMNPRHPWKFDLFTGKAFDCSCPLGPRIVPARFIDPSNLQLRLSVNGRVRQDANSSDMIWNVAEQLSILSEHITLEPGDILLTGTPAGVGMASGEYLKAGDLVEAEIEGLGKLAVEITPTSPTERTPRPG
jgi:2-keto-4-pentenoate hydratase/2-oxohepta-3-ene-1,7-dioic acid hydratase in catechol pathway